LKRLVCILISFSNAFQTYF